MYVISDVLYTSCYSAFQHLWQLSDKVDCEKWHSIIV